jgi:methyl-accepting chemotaxis protein
MVSDSLLAGQPRHSAHSDVLAVHGKETEPAQARRIAELEEEVELYRAILKQVIDVSSEAAQGNLEPRILHYDDSSQFRELARSVNHLLDMTDAFLREVGAALEHASQGKYFRRVLLRGMRGTFRHKSQMINAATETMARNTQSAKTVEGLVSESAQISQEAVREASEAGDVVRGLGEASTKIGKAVKSISQIAWQTRLLAFNAKIEASRAGEAGRGFDVVAQEVKELAQETATATDEISREIAVMTEEVGRTSRAIESMSKTIAQMQDISANIERAMVERSDNVR